MADTGKRIGPHQPGLAATTRYTVPAATSFFIQTIRVQNPSGATVLYTMSIGADAAATRFFAGESIPANGSIDWNGFIPMAATEILQDFADSATTLVVVIGGVEVT